MYPAHQGCFAAHCPTRASINCSASVTRYSTTCQSQFICRTSGSASGSDRCHSPLAKMQAGCGAILSQDSRPVWPPTAPLMSQNCSCIIHPLPTILPSQFFAISGAASGHSRCHSPLAKMQAGCGAITLRHSIPVLPHTAPCVAIKLL
jgi:hypothetical protein